MKHGVILTLILSIVYLPSCQKFQEQAPSVHIGLFMTLEQNAASRFAQLALSGIQREYPNKLGHVMNDVSEVKNPGALHPAFYGSFDWHSSVHGHWMLVRLLKQFPQLPEGAAIRRALHKNLSREHIAVEVAYLKQPLRASFERTYPLEALERSSNASTAVGSETFTG